MIGAILQSVQGLMNLKDVGEVLVTTLGEGRRAHAARKAIDAARLCHLCGAHGDFGLDDKSRGLYAYICSGCYKGRLRRERWALLGRVAIVLGVLFLLVMCNAN